MMFLVSSREVDEFRPLAKHELFSREGQCGGCKCLGLAQQIAEFLKCFPSLDILLEFQKVLVLSILSFVQSYKHLDLCSVYS